MARFDVDSGRSFQLAVRGYQYPEIGSGWDGNWLLIEIEVVAGSQRWRAREPALTTWELAELVNWLRDVSAGVTRTDRFDATEPNLSFRAVGADDNVRLTAFFKLEFAHPDLDYEERIEGDAVEFLLSAEELRRFADEVEAEGVNYPLRSQPA